MKKNLLFLYLLLFSTASLFAQPKLDATVSYELNNDTGNYRLKIVINQDISFQFTENYTSSVFVMIIKDLYTDTPDGGTSGGENTLNYVSTNATNATGTSNGLGTYKATYGPFSFPEDEQIGFGMSGSFNTNDFIRIKAGTIIQDPGNFNTVPTINPGPYTVVIANQNFDGIAATAVTESVLNIEEQKIANDVSFYPNPVNDYLSLNSKSAIQKVELFGLTGAKLDVKISDLSKIDVSNLQSGIYLLKAETEKGTTIKKILVN
tara:strand:+ start:11388 stop:12176 length:789 start_codon:yes stop_codon:yes gene_type:complete